jgi:hypothetical protein
LLGGVAIFLIRRRRACSPQSPPSVPTSPTSPLHPPCRGDRGGWGQRGVWTDSPQAADDRPSRYPLETGFHARIE